MYNVLIVDDEIIERNGIEFLIKQKKYDFNCYKAENGIEALSVIKDNDIDLVITDIKMPLMGGIELCEKIRQNYNDILIVILSGYSDFNFARKAIQYNVKDYILKPVIMDDFYNCMDKVVKELSKKAENGKASSGLDKNDETHYIQNDKKVISDIIDLIEKNFCMDISLEWVAEKMYLSAGYLSTLFKKETGKSIIQYITICRMEKAKTMLLETNMKMVDVCQKVGYNSTSYFCLIFKKYFGVTPLGMRENGEVIGVEKQE